MSASNDEAARPLSSPRRRFRWQFGLRTLLGVILVACVAFAYLAHYRREYERQFEREQPAIKAIAEIGGKCEMSADAPALARWLAGDKMSRVVAVDLANREIGSGIGPQGCFPIFSLRQRITDGWLPQLATLEHLETLRLSGNPLRGDGLTVLQELGQLRTLDLSDCPIEEENLVSLESLAKLESLRLGGVQVGDEGLRHVGALANLVELQVGRPAEVPAYLDESQEPPMRPQGITIEGLRYLRPLWRLERLYLDGAELSEPEIEVLEALPNLQKLDLGASHVTPAAIDRLRGWTSLCELRLSHSSQPAEITAILDLKKACPKLIVDVYPPILPDGTAPRPPPPPP